MNAYLLAFTILCPVLVGTKEIGYAIAPFWCPGTVKSFLSITNIIKCLYHFRYDLPWYYLVKAPTSVKRTHMLVFYAQPRVDHKGVKKLPYSLSVTPMFFSSRFS